MAAGNSAASRSLLARAVPPRPRVTWWISLAIAAALAVVLVPIITADRWAGAIAPGAVVAGERAKLTVRLPPFAGYPTAAGRLGGNGAGVLVARGDTATADDAANADALADAMPHGPAPYLAYFAIACVLAALFSYHARRSIAGRLVRVQVVSAALIAATALAVKVAMLTTAVSVLVVPISVFALVPTLALDRSVGLATGTLAALVTAMLVPFDVGVAILLLVQTSVAGLVIAERPKHRARATLIAGGAATLLTAVTYPLLEYLRTGQMPGHELADPLRSAWLAAVIGPAVATVLALALVPAYQLLVGEITQGTLIELEDLSQPLLKQIAERSPGTWQHSLMMANLAEIAANAIGANGKLVRVGALYHDLGKSLHPKYFIENLEPGETSPHDQLPPEVSCDAIFAHVVEGLVVARKAGLHERIVDFMHMHHGDGVLEYFWAKCQEQGNPKGLTVDDFRYPGVRPQTRETAILAICDAVEAASRTLKKAELPAIASLVQRIVYGKLHLGQLDESGLSMRDLRVIADSLRETIRHANHGRIEYPWQKEAAASGASDEDAATVDVTTTTSPRLDSLDRPARAARGRAAKAGGDGDGPNTDAFAETANLGGAPERATERLTKPAPAAIPIPIPIPTPTPAATIAAAPAPAPIVARTPTPQVVKTTAIGVPAAPMPMPTPAPVPSRPREFEPPERDSDPAFSGETRVVSAAMAANLAAAAAYAPDPSAGPVELARTQPTLSSPLATAMARHRELKVSRDGLPHVEPNRPSDGDSRIDAGAPESIDDNEPDTGRHRVAKLAADSREEIAQFTAEAQRALDAAGRDAARDPRVTSPSNSPTAPIAVAAPRPPRAATVEPASAPLPGSGPLPSLPALPGARKRAATLPPTTELMRPPSRRAITAPPMRAPMHRPPAMIVEDERARDSAPPANVPAEPDAATTVPSLLAPPTMTIKPARMRSNALVIDPLIEREAGRPSTPPAGTPAAAQRPGPPPPPQPAAQAPTYNPPPPMPAPFPPPGVDDRDAAVTAPSIPVSALAIPPLPRTPSSSSGPHVIASSPPPPPAPSRGATWATGLAARIDAQLDGDDDATADAAFNVTTPVSAPSPADIQAMLDAPPDTTRRLSVDEVERLHQQKELRPSSPELELTRRAPYPTAEVREEDIEAAIEIVPTARRSTAIGVAKKKPPGA